MGRKNAGDRRAKRRANAEKKKKKKEAEAKRKTKSAGVDEEDDIEAILKQVEQECSKRSAALEKSSRPSPRVSASLSAHPAKDELLLFGGEFCSGPKTFVYNDLYAFATKKNEWRELVLPKPPPPRSAHQAVVVPKGDGGELWVFGGEFTSPKGGQFYHYNDLWVLHLSTKEWEKVDAKGHRMVHFKRQLIVFGGFTDDGKRSPKYYSDVHIFSLEARSWTRLSFPAIFPSPEPRSGCQFVATEERVLVYGGYSKVKTKKDYAGKVHEDMWFLEPNAMAGQQIDQSLTGQARKDAIAASTMMYKWQRAKPGGIRIEPRSGATMALRGTVAYSFGGVLDEEDEDEIRGTFFDDLHALDLQSLRWQSVQLRTPKPKGAKAKARGKRRKGQRLEDDLGLAGLAIGGDEAAAASSGSDDGAEAELHWPSVRMNTMLAAKGNLLYLFGGQFELGDRPITLSDFHVLDTSKLHEWQRLQDNDPRTRQWLEEESESSSDDDDGDDPG